MKRQLLRIVADEDCVGCSGTGLKISHEHADFQNTVIIRVVVCKCVRVVRQMPKVKQ